MAKKPKIKMRNAGKNAKAAKAFSFVLEENPIPSNIDELSKFVDKAARTTLSYYEPQVENWAKKNAPWKDQTTNARNGLIAQSGHDRSLYWLVLAHRVSYGIFLETRFGEKYAIIMPTLELYGPKIMSTFDKILERFKP